MASKHSRSERMFRHSPEPPGQPALLPPSIEELIPLDHIVRQIKACAASLDLSAVESQFGESGGYPYPPHLVLGVLLFGMMDRERSSRRLAEHCLYDVRYRYLCEGLAPHYRTISRFRRRLLEESSELLSQVISRAVACGIIEPGGALAVDGTKVAGSVKQWRKMLSSDDLSETADPDARTMVCARSGYVNGYNARAAVDLETGLVVASEVTNQASDAPCLAEFIDQATARLGQTPSSAVADRGFESAENASALEERQVTPYLRPKGDSALFWKVNEQDQLICPEGHAATRFDRFERYGHDTIRLHVPACKSCPKRPTCHKAVEKTISYPATANPAARVRNAHRCRSPEGIRMLRRRSSIETVFGQMKCNMSFQKFLLRGLWAVEGEFNLQCLAYNLQKLLGGLLHVLKALQSQLRRQRDLPNVLRSKTVSCKNAALG